VVPANGRTELGWLDARDELGLFEIAWSAPGLAGSNHYVTGPRPFELHKLIGNYRKILGDQPVDEQIVSNGAAKRQGAQSIQRRK
jgi:hypothetical protein